MGMPGHMEFLIIGAFLVFFVGTVAAVIAVILVLTRSTRAEDSTCIAPEIESREARQWAMFLHLSMLASFLVPFAGLIAPIVLWQVKKDELPEIDVHGKIVVNWILSWMIYTAVSLLLVCVIIGIPLLIILGVLGVVFPIIGGLKANNGETWRYPFSIRFLK